MRNRIPRTLETNQTRRYPSTILESYGFDSFTQVKTPGIGESLDLNDGDLLGDESRMWYQEEVSGSYNCLSTCTRRDHYLHEDAYSINEFIQR